MPTVREITEQKEWENFVLSSEYSLFVQSWHYGEFYEALGERFKVFGVYDSSGKLKGGSLVVTTHAKRGRFLYLPYGPLVSPHDEEALRALNTKIVQFARDEKYQFIRVSPFWEKSEQTFQALNRLSYRDAPMHILAETTWLLNVQGKSEDELLADMNKNHRNLIRRTQRDGVRTESGTDAAMLADFNRLHDETARRHGFVRFSRAYIEREYESFAPSGNAMVIHGFLPSGELDSSGIFILYGNMACYRHGASRTGDRRLPTSYAVLWRAVQEAKKRGVKWFNFWGIAPDGAPDTHPFFGITHFKKGFGGRALQLQPCADLPLSPAYMLTRGIEALRKIRRGF